MVFRLRLGVVLGAVVLRVVVVVIRDRFLVIARRKRRRDVGAEGGGDDVRRVRIDPRVVQIRVDGVKCPVRVVEEVASLGIEHRPEVVVIPRCGLDAFGRLRIEDEDRAVTSLETLGIGQPATVMRPVQLEGRELAVQHVESAVDLRHHLGLDVDDLDPLRLIDEGDFPAVRCPE